MDEILTVGEIKTRYHEGWAVVIDLESKPFEPMAKVKGRLVAICPTKHEAFDALEAFPHSGATVVYLGEEPKYVII